MISFKSLSSRNGFLLFSACAILILGIIGYSFRKPLQQFMDTLFHIQPNTQIHGYLWKDSRNAAFIEWTEQSGNLTGTYYYAYETPDNQFKSGNLSIKGVINGSSISISVPDTGVTWTGTLSGGSLTLAMPQSDGTVQSFEYQEATLSDYNNAVESIRNSALEAQQAQAQQQAENKLHQEIDNLAAAVSEELNSLKQDEESLSSNVSSTGKDIEQERSDLAQTEHDKQKVLNEKGSVDVGQLGSDAAQVGSDAAQVGSDDAQIQSDNAQVSSDIDAIEKTISSLQSDYEKLSADLASASGYSPPNPIPSQSDIDSAISNANAAIAKAKDQMNSYLAQSKQMVNTAQQDANAASNAAE